MSAISFQKTKKMDLHQLSYILFKTDPLDTEFNAVACSFTGALV